MKNWGHKKLDSLAKREKIRKSKAKSTDKSKLTLETEFELNASEWNEFISKGYFTARVMEVHKRYAFISPEPNPLNIDTSDVWLGTIARKFTQTHRKERNFVAVGDIVLCRPAKNDEVNLSQDLPSCVIEHRSPRTCRIARLDPMTREREHVLAANVTQLVVVASYVYPKVKWGLIDRYLLLAEEEGIKTVIILNKKDLLESQKDDFRDLCEHYKNIYQSLNYKVLETQAKDCSSNETKQISSIFKNNISIVSGHSGVGKSTIINLLEPEIIQEVETEEILTKGRHTTTYSSMLRLPHGGFVIDTPGIRSFLLEDRDSLSLAYGFIEFRPFLNQCKYRECKHIDEPGCAILSAVDQGAISKLRYKSYLTILTGANGREGRLRSTLT